MSSLSQTPEASASRPRNNAVTASVPADWAPDPATLEATPFAAAVDHVLQLTAELARNLIGAHQGAATLLIAGDWTDARKWFSLSSRYAEWFDYRAPAVGFGIHALVVTTNEPIRLTQVELEAQPAWKAFGREAGKHPLMRGWLAVPLVGKDQRNYGLLQVSDKYNDAKFTADDELHLTQLAQLTASALMPSAPSIKTSVSGSRSRRPPDTALACHAIGRQRRSQTHHPVLAASSLAPQWEGGRGS